LKVAKVAHVARRLWRGVPELKDAEHLRLTEELHAIEAVIAGQGIGVFSDVLVVRNWQMARW
jgi:LysR family glycine cleavage system transcriptional activator